MIAVDTCTWIAYIQGEDAKDTDILDSHFNTGDIGLPPVVISELLSDSKLSAKYKNRILEAVFLKPDQGYWERAGLTRAKLIRKKCKPKLPDTLIAQSCIDHNVPLLTRDTGFAIFAKHAGLKLVTT